MQYNCSNHIYSQIYLGVESNIRNWFFLETPILLSGHAKRGGGTWRVFLYVCNNTFVVKAILSWRDWKQFGGLLYIARDAKQQWVYSFEDF